MKISIVGMGKVGSTLAYALTLKGSAKELVLIGRDRNALIGEALDLDHAQSFIAAPARIRAGELKDAGNSDIIVISASVPTPASMTDRATLGPDNVQLFRTILPELAKRAPEAILLILSNPVDVLTYYAIQLTGFPASRVIGSGTFIDSARFRRMLSEDVGIHTDDLRAYVLGEHGPSQFAAWSVATAGGERIEESPARRKMFQEAAAAGITIFKHKGYTNYGIAQAAAAIVESIALDEKHTVPVSTLIDGYLGVNDVCLSLPVVLGRNGIERVLHPPLNTEESLAFRNCAESVRRQIDACSKT